MKRLMPILCVLFACVPNDAPGVSSPGDAATVPANQNLTAFRNVSVIPMTGESRLLSNQTVIVKNGRIEAIGKDLSIPAKAVTVDGTGLYLIPGLAEMHGHVPPPSADAQLVEDTLFLYVANGITTVRGMLGAPGQLALRERAATGSIISPTLYLAGPSFNGNSVSSPDQAREMVRRQNTEGWNLLKVHPGLTRAEYDAMAEIANELGIRFGGHVPEDVGFVHALEMNQETFDHLDGYLEALSERPIPDSAIRNLAVATREAGAWVVPTMALWETLLGTVDLNTLRDYDELRYVPASTVEQWSSAFSGRQNDPSYDEKEMRRYAADRIRLLRILHEEGVLILLGTDAPQQFSVPGFSLHRELDWMARSGMEPYDILVSGTTNVGRYFANEDDFGVIAPGQRADLVLLRSNPLEGHRALAQIEGVMANGHWLSREAIDRRLSEIDARYE